jgi:hypothetical protein
MVTGSCPQQRRRCRCDSCQMETMLWFPFGWVGALVLGVGAALLVFGRSLVGMMIMFYMVEGVVCCAVAKVVIWQVWHASSTPTVVEGAGCGNGYRWEVHSLLLIDDNDPTGSRGLFLLDGRSNHRWWQSGQFSLLPPSCSPDMCKHVGCA